MRSCEHFKVRMMRHCQICEQTSYRRVVDLSEERNGRANMHFCKESYSSLHGPVINMVYDLGQGVQ